MFYVHLCGNFEIPILIYNQEELIMTRAVIIGMALALFAATGCNDKSEQIKLNKKVARLSDQVAFLKTRIEAIETATLELNSRISTTAASIQQQAVYQEATVKSESSRPSRPAMPARDTGGLLSLTPNLHSRPTRLTFNNRMVGRTLTEVLATVGKPDKTSKVAGAKHWIYKTIMLDKKNGGVERKAALIVLENDTVTRAVLMDHVEYSSESRKMNQPAPQKKTSQ